MFLRIALLCAAISPAHAFATPAPLPTVNFLIRVGSDLLYYGACDVRTNILEPASADTSHLMIRSCQSFSQTTTSAPTWVMDSYASYGSAYMGESPLGQCWLIRHQFIAGGNMTMTIECSIVPVIFGSGFDR
jgi:hypothetical protein